MVALLGQPVAHSASPALHNAAFLAAGIDAVYVAFDVDADRVGDAVEAVRALGLLGANVTVPHKRAVWERADDRTPEAELVGAANTLFWDAGRLVADNTDATGLTRVLERDVDLREGDEVVLFGAGGAARAAAVALGRLGAAVEVVARREGPRVEVASLVGQAGGRAASAQRPRVVVNATPLGLGGEALPERFMSLGPGQVALDLVYGSADTPFLAAARQRGAEAIDGLGMLVEQAELAFARWTGMPAPADVMGRTAREVLGQR